MLRPAPRRRSFFSPFSLTPTPMTRHAVAIALLLPLTFTPACGAGSQTQPDERAQLAADAAAQQPQGNVSLPRMPSISPDGQTIVFSWHGDLWSVPAAGGNAIRISSHPADESWTRFSPDGARIAFN